MKVVAVLMILIGLAVGAGAVLEFVYYTPEVSQFWVGVFTTPAAAFFVMAGVMLWLRGVYVRHIVLISALLMAGATIAATALRVMGPPATLTGIVGSLLVVVWFWSTRRVAV